MPLSHKIGCCRRNCFAKYRFFIVYYFSRHLHKQGGDQENVTPDVRAQIEDMISKMEKVDLDNELFFSDDSLSESNEQSK